MWRYFSICTFPHRVPMPSRPHGGEHYVPCFIMSMSSVTEFHFHFLIGQLQHRQFGPRGVLRSFESSVTLFYVFPFPRCSFPTTSFWSIWRALRSLDSGLTHSTFFYLLRRSLPTTSYGPHGDEHCVRGNFDTIRHFFISSVAAPTGSISDHMERNIAFVGILTHSVIFSISSTCSSDSGQFSDHMELNMRSWNFGRILSFSISSTSDSSIINLEHMEFVLCVREESQCS